MANPSNITPLQQHHATSTAAEVHFTRRMRDVLVRRGLEATYLTRFVRDNGAAPVYALTVGEMEALLELLEPMRQKVERYDKVAVDALERELDRILFTERTRDLRPAPEVGLLRLLGEQMSTAVDSPALLRVGEHMLTVDGDRVTIDGVYGLYSFITDHGRFYDRHGNRIDFLWGYSVRLPDGTSAVAKPCDLTHIDGRQSHLQLVIGGDHE